MTAKVIEPRRRLVLPLDVGDLASARELVGRLSGEVGVLKVGLELFTAEGPAAVSLVHDAGAECFLDLKLHDIPNTVGHAVASAARMGVRYLTVHATNGPSALAAAAKAARGSETRLLAVTVLTSMDATELAAVGIAGTPEEAVIRLARLAIDAGIDGLVTSPNECAALRRALGAGPLLVTPGVRPAGSGPGDQRRAATPGSAIAAGADLLVVGRPIREAPDPVQAARAIAREIEAALAARGSS